MKTYIFIHRESNVKVYNILWWYPNNHWGYQYSFLNTLGRWKPTQFGPKKNIPKFRGFTTCCTLHDHHPQDKFTKMKRAPLKFNIAPDKNMTIRLSLQLEKRYMSRQGRTVKLRGGKQTCRAHPSHPKFVVTNQHIPDVSNTYKQMLLGKISQTRQKTSCLSSLINPWQYIGNPIHQSEKYDQQSSYSLIPWPFLAGLLSYIQNSPTQALQTGPCSPIVGHFIMKSKHLFSFTFSTKQG